MKKILSVIGNRFNWVKKWILAKKLSKSTKIFQCGNHANNNIRVKLSIVCIARNEDLYLDEWVTFHLNKGVEIIFFYDNAEADPAANKTKIILERYIRSGHVIYIRIRDFVGQRIGSVKNLSRLTFNTQELAYFHFKRNFGKITEFYIKLDLDEFVYTCDGSKLSCHLDIESVLPLWGFNFGSSGHLTAKHGLVIERFKHRAKDLSHVKSINRTANVYEFFNAHLAFIYPWKCSAMPSLEPHLHSVLRLNHYKMKSREEFLIRKGVAPSSYLYGDFDTSEFEGEDSKLNEIYDEEILKWRIQL